MNVAHVFYGVHMGLGFPGLSSKVDAKKIKMKHGDAVIFVSTKWNACKVLYPDGVMIYFRPGRFIEPDEIASLPTKIGTSSYRGAWVDTLYKTHAGPRRKKAA